MFHTNLPVVGADFFNRAQELKQLQELVQRLEAGSPQWLTIIGSRKVGKSSLLLELARRAADSKVRFLVIDVMEAAPVSVSFFRLYALRAVDALLGAEAGESLERLASKPRAFGHAVVRVARAAALSDELTERILDLSQDAIDDALIRDHLGLPEELAAALGKRLLVAIDEFQELASLTYGRRSLDPYPIMRAIWQRHRHVAYVISGSARTMLTDLVSSTHSPFFQHFSLMELRTFDSADAEALLLASSPEGLEIAPKIAQQVVEVVEAHPFYVQLVGEALVRQPPPLDQYALKAALQEVLFARTGRLGLYFQTLWQRIVGRASTLAACLSALAQKGMRLSELAESIGTSSAAAASYLDRLGDDVVHQDGMYRLADSTFGLWIRWRSPGGSVVPMTLVGDEAEKHVAKELARMGFDLIYQSRASRGAFDLMATRGARQVGVQVKRSKLPLRFRKTEWNRMVADAAKFGWQWVVAAVDERGRVSWLDPADVKQGREMRLAADAGIDNLLTWLES